MNFCASVMYSLLDIVSVDKLSRLACEKYVLIEFTFSSETKYMHMQLTFASFLKIKKIIKMFFFFFLQPLLQISITTMRNSSLQTVSNPSSNN